MKSLFVETICFTVFFYLEQRFKNACEIHFRRRFLNEAQMNISI